MFIINDDPNEAIDVYMNYVLIFAGGTGQRMNTVSLPKQFLKVHDVPILVHTIRHFQNCSLIDGILVVCLKDYIPYVFELKDEYRLDKIIDVIPGGDTGQGSIRNGLFYLENKIKGDDIVLIHDGVRPLINEETIVNNINCVLEKGNAITTAKSTETVLVLQDDNVNQIVDRSLCQYGRAPQSFYFRDILSAHKKALKDNLSFIDSACLMRYYGYTLHAVLGPSCNIKITTPIDYFIFRAIIEQKENEQIKFI